VAQHLGETQEARAAFEAVVEATDVTRARLNRLDVLAVPALTALGRNSGDLAEQLESVRVNLGDDIDGRLVRRALTIGEGR
jgi:hypothetical protein